MVIDYTMPSYTTDNKVDITQTLRNNPHLDARPTIAVVYIDISCGCHAKDLNTVAAVTLEKSPTKGTTTINKHKGFCRFLSKDTMSSYKS